MHKGKYPTSFLRVKRTNFTALLSGLILLCFFLMALVGPWFSPWNPNSQDLVAALTPPWGFPRGTLEHVLGTDFLGRDVFARIIYGCRISFFIGLATALCSAGIGTLVGLLGGYLGGRVDRTLMRLVDIQLTIPRLLLAIAIIALLGPGLFNVTFVLIITDWMVFARVVRGEVLALKEQEFVLAARAVGCPVLLIIFRHLLPNVTSSLIVLATFAFARAIISESSLSFLGIGIEPPTPTWGGMLSEGQLYMIIAPWLAIVPGIALMLTVLAANSLGDWLRDKLDPVLRRT
jgi:peptide/nickel transport system permease protein